MTIVNVNYRGDQKEQGAELPRRSKDGKRMTLSGGTENTTGFHAIGFYCLLSFHWVGGFTDTFVRPFGRFVDSESNPGSPENFGLHRICDKDGVPIEIDLNQGADGGCFVLDNGGGADFIEFKFVNGAGAAKFVNGEFVFAKCA